MIDFATGLQDHPNAIDPNVADFVKGAVEEIGKGNNLERSSIIATGTVKNVVITASTAATLAAISLSAVATGSPILIVGAGATALVVGEGLKKSKPFAEVVALITKGLDKFSEDSEPNTKTKKSNDFQPQLKFILDMEENIRKLASQREEFKWVERSMDWIKDRVKK